MTRRSRTAIVVLVGACVLAGLVALGWRITRQPSFYEDPTDAPRR